VRSGSGDVMMKRCHDSTTLTTKLQLFFHSVFGILAAQFSHGCEKQALQLFPILFSAGINDTLSMSTQVTKYIQKDREL
jgi:hypothetical protein